MIHYGLQHIPAVGDFVVFGASGVCRIREISEQDFLGSPRPYLTLERVGNEGAVNFVPIDSEELLSLLRPLISREDALAIPSKASAAAFALPSDRKKRTELIRALLNESDPVRMLALVRAFRIFENDLTQKRRRLSYADADFFETTLRILREELTLVLNDTETINQILASV